MPRADVRGAPRVLAVGGARSRWRATLAALLTLATMLAGCTADQAVHPDAVGTEAAPADDGPPPAVAPSSDEVADVDQADEPDESSAPGERSASELDPEPPPPAAGRDALVGQAKRMLAAALAEAETGHLAVLVVDEHGREIVAHAVDEPLMPASTLKTLTAAAILSTLGPRHRITTMVETTAAIDGGGTIAGDLVLIGAGDPALATPEYGRWVYPARPRTPLEALADQLIDAGVTRIGGDVWATAPGFSGPRVPDGWPDRYFSSFDARYSDGLTVDGGLRTIISYPDPDDDEADGPDVATLETSAGEVEIEVAAEVGEDPDRSELDPEELGPPIVRVDHVDEPPLHAASELIRLLEERDVEVVGAARAGDPDAVIVGRLATVESPPMLDLLRFAMQRSDNHLTDGLFRLAGRARTGDGSFAAGERALRQVLDRYGIDHSQAVFADGSGLSRDDRATARLLVDVDRAMVASRHGAAWAAIMASMGQSGTLDRRLRGTVAEGRFLGKTGTLRDTTALSGSVIDADGARYHLAVIANDEGATRAIARGLADELILLLVADLDGCDVLRPGEDEGPIGLPALAVAC